MKRVGPYKKNAKCFMENIKKYGRPPKIKTILI